MQHQRAHPSRCMPRAGLGRWPLACTRAALAPRGRGRAAMCRAAPAPQVVGAASVTEDVASTEDEVWVGETSRPRAGATCPRVPATCPVAAGIDQQHEWHSSSRQLSAAGQIHRLLGAAIRPQRQGHQQHVMWAHEPACLHLPATPWVLRSSQRRRACTQPPASSPTPPRPPYSGPQCLPPRWTPTTRSPGRSCHSAQPLAAPL